MGADVLEGIIYRVSARARRIRLTIHTDRRIVLTVPRQVPLDLAQRFVIERQAWIQRALERLPEPSNRPTKEDRKQVYHLNKPAALARVTSRVEYFAQQYGFRYRSIHIRNSKTRWGSCNRHGDLTFNHYLMRLTVEQLDYLVVHEVCHLKEMNHSFRFWNLVAQAVPDYLVRRKELKRLSRELF